MQPSAEASPNPNQVLCALKHLRLVPETPAPDPFSQHYQAPWASPKLATGVYSGEKTVFHLEELVMKGCGPVTAEKTMKQKPVSGATGIETCWGSPRNNDTG